MSERPPTRFPGEEPAAQPGAGEPPSSGHYSPDGRWWWDGRAWQPIAVPPPARQYSPDGRWWWDGQTWSPTNLGTAGKSKLAAGLLAILLGDFGIHKFYLGQVWLGVLYLVFFWTLIPGLLGLIEGIFFLTMSDEQFLSRYGTPELAAKHLFF